MTPDKENREASQDDPKQDGMQFMFVPQLPEALFEEDGFAQADIDALIAENECLRALEASVLRMADHLRNGFWEPSPEMGAVLEIHSAITGLHNDMEEIAAERDKLKEEVKALRKAKG